MRHFFKKSINIALIKNKPVSLIHFLTNRCNARCAHCFIDFDNDETQKCELSIEEIDQMTKKVGSQLMNVNFTGGEPFLYRDIEKAAELYITNAKVDSIYFSTNGGLTKKIVKTASALSRKYPNTIFTYSISIDHIKEKHDNYRKVKNLYKNAIESYRELLKFSSNVNPHITITVSEYNYKDINEIFFYLKDVEKVKNITANIVRDEGVYKINHDIKQELFNSYKNLIENIEYYQMYSYDTNFLGRMMSKKELIMYDYLREYYMEPSYKLKCTAGGGLMGVIYPNGDVYPCEILSSKMGNLYNNNMDIMKIWKQSKKIRKDIRTTKCHCSYECAWSYNILSSPKHIAQLAISGVKKF